MKTNPPVTNCGFGCLLSIIVVMALLMIGLILFAFVVRQYKYMERDDRPYDYYRVEDISLIDVTACDLHDDYLTSN